MILMYFRYTMADLMVINTFGTQMNDVHFSPQLFPVEELEESFLFLQVFIHYFTYS